MMWTNTTRLADPFARVIGLRMKFRSVFSRIPTTSPGRRRATAGGAISSVCSSCFHHPRGRPPGTPARCGGEASPSRRPHARRHPAPSSHSATLHRRRSSSALLNCQAGDIASNPHTAHGAGLRHTGGSPPGPASLTPIRAPARLGGPLRWICRPGRRVPPHRLSMSVRLPPMGREPDSGGCRSWPPEHAPGPL